MLKKRADKIIVGDEKASTIIKKIIDESETSVSLYPTIKKINEGFVYDRPMSKKMIVS